MKKILLFTFTLSLIISGVECRANTTKEEVTQLLEQEEIELVETPSTNQVKNTDNLPELVECFAGYSYNGAVAEVVTIGDNPETEFIEGSLVIEMADEELGAVIVYLTSAMSIEDIEDYGAGDTVQLVTKDELNFKNPKDLPHISPFTLFKSTNK